MVLHGAKALRADQDWEQPKLTGRGNSANSH